MPVWRVRRGSSSGDSASAGVENSQITQHARTRLLYTAYRDRPEAEKCRFSGDATQPSVSLTITGIDLKSKYNGKSNSNGKHKYNSKYKGKKIG